MTKNIWIYWYQYQRESSFFRKLEEKQKVFYIFVS